VYHCTISDEINSLLLDLSWHDARRKRKWKNLQNKSKLIEHHGWMEGYLGGVFGSWSLKLYLCMPRYLTKLKRRFMTLNQNYDSLHVSDHSLSAIPRQSRELELCFVVHVRNEIYCKVAMRGSFNNWWDDCHSPLYLMRMHVLTLPPYVCIKIDLIVI